MVKHYLLLIGVVWLLAACSGDEASPNNPSPNMTPRIQVTVSEALIFEIPSRESVVLFRLIEGDERPILAQTPTDAIGVTWYQVSNGDVFGWVAGSQVTVLGNVEAVRTVSESVWDPTLTPDPVTRTPPSVITATPQPTEVIVTAIIAKEDAPVYAEPRLTTRPRFTLARNTLVDVLGQIGDEDDANFWLIGQGGQVLGWLTADDLRSEADLTVVPVIEALDADLSEIMPSDVAALSLVTITPPPTATSLPDLASTARSAPTATAIDPTIPPTDEVVGISMSVPPPYTIDLPPEWESVNFSLPVNSPYLQGNLPITIYEGSLGDGLKGLIWLVWGFPNITSPSGELNLYADGVQLLRSLVFDAQSCNIGLGDEQRDYTVGPYQAIGTIYSAVDCADAEDIAGIFAVVRVNEVNYAFFLGVEPVERVGDGLPTLEAVLRSIQFDED